ncbi:MAG: class I SAM-dependent methyltransferase [Flavobacteriales bacterium]
MGKALQQRRTDPDWVAERFDRIASSYSLFERLFLVPRNAAERAVEQLQLRDGQYVLEVGCGKGPLLPSLSNAVGELGRVVALDLSEKMLIPAQCRIQENGLRNVELLHSDLFDHDDRGRSDAALFAFSLSSFGEPARALRNVWNRLGPGGRLVVLDGQLPPRLSWITRPAMPAIRWFLEHTVLGDPDMRPLELLADLGGHMEVEWFRGRTYFVACVTKPR